MRNNAVPGEGDFGAEIMFIGEGPGQNEDLEGRPFCGAAGKLLDELITSIGLERSQVFISNVVKCRPPQNRDPKPTEIATCFPYLMRQIELINPKVIVTLGRHSMGEFLPESLGPISKIHGQIFPSHDSDRLILPLYHPAVALYNAKMKDVLIEDFKKIKEAIG